MVFNCFDRVYIIHLPNPQRFEAMEKQLSGLGITGAKYVHAARLPSHFMMSTMRRSPPGEFGCSLSHLVAVVTAIADGAERPLFLEDDVVFREDYAKILESALTGLPADWDILYMGGHPREKVERVGINLVRVGTFSFAESYSIARKSLLPFFQFWCNRIGQKSAMYDFVLGEFAKSVKGFCVYPVITHQPEMLSQIGGVVDDKYDLVNRGWKANV